MIMKKVFVTFLCLILLCACHNSKKTETYPVLKVSFGKEKISALDIFDKFEIVSLETNDSSLLVWPDKVLYWKGQYMVFDSKTPSLFVFDENGNFIKKIGKRGDGPEEYTEIYDVIQDKETGEIDMLSPYGEIFVYTSEGAFIKRTRLPQKSNYQSFEDCGNYFITWTLPNAEDEDGISLISKNNMQCVKSYWKGNRNLYFLYPRAFYKYGEDVFFSRPFSREVYRVSKDKMNIAYKWDFGKDNYSIEDWDISPTHSGGEQESSLLIKKLKDSTIPYIITHQAQTAKYYYSKLALGFTPKGQYHIFYRKEDGKSFFFRKTLEGINLNPLFFCDNFILCLASNEDLDKYMKVLGKTEADKILDRKEDDNPVLIKCYYK